MDIGYSYNAQDISSVPSCLNSVQAENESDEVVF